MSRTNRDSTVWAQEGRIELPFLEVCVLAIFEVIRTQLPFIKHIISKHIPFVQTTSLALLFWKFR